MSEPKLPQRKVGQPPVVALDEDDKKENEVASVQLRLPSNDSDDVIQLSSDTSDGEKGKKDEKSNETIELDDDEDESSEDDRSVSLKSSNESVENLAWNSEVAAPRQQSAIGNQTANVEGDKNEEIECRLTDDQLDDESDTDDETFDEDEELSDGEEEEEAIAQQYQSAYINNFDFECFDMHPSGSDNDMEIDEPSTSSGSDFNALKEVPDAWTDSNKICGANALDEEEQQACEFFKQTQQNLNRWNNEPKNEQLAGIYFDSVHDLLQLRPFKRLRRNPYSIEKESNLRLYNFSSLLSAYFTTHKQLAELVHNSVPHHLQVLVIDPENKELWYRVGRLAAETGDWKNAEFAYRQFIHVSKETEKGLQAIALVHFISGDFLKCLDDIKAILDNYPNNIIASVLISELSRLNGPWSGHVKRAIILYGFERNIPNPERMKLVLERIQAFRERLEQQCSECKHELKSLNEPATKMILTAEDLSFSHFAKRLIKFQDEVKKNPGLFLSFEYLVDNNSVDEKTRTVSTPTVLQSAPATSEPSAQTQLPEVSHPQAEEEMECDENLNVEKEAENLMSDLLGRIEVDVEKELTDEPPTKKQRLSARPRSDAYVRRSTRFLEETFDDRLNTSQQTWDIKTCLRVNRNTNFEFPSSLKLQSNINRSLPINPPMEKLDEHVEIPEFLHVLINQDKWQRGLNGYAKVVVKLLDHVQKEVQCKGYGLEADDKTAFLLLYHKLTEMSSIVETKPMMNVELFAAEIGSESALKKLNEYARSLTHQHLKDVDDFEQSIEARDTVHVESSSDWIDKVEASGDSMMRSLVRMRQELRKTTPPKSAEYKKPNYRMINYVNGLTENSLLQTTLQNLGHQKPLDLCVDEGTLILCQPDFLPYGLIAPEVKLLTIKERQFLCRYHSFQALKFRNSKYNEERSAYQALEWKHLLVMLKILNDHNLMSCTEDLGVTPEELEWSSERLVFLTHEIKSRNAICSLISINENKIQVVMDYCVKEHDYTTENVDSSLTYLTLLYHCYCTKGNYKEMFSTILRISKILLDDSIERTSTLMPTFCFCLKQLDLHLKTFLALPDVTHKKLAKLLSLFTDKSLYRTVAPLWMLCYRLTVIESKETVEEFEEHFDRAKQAANFLPTRGLMLLREGHEVMADENCCMADQGVFIRYYLKQLNRCVKLEAYEEALTCFVSGMATELKQNVENEIIQGVMCLHNLTINTRKQRIRSHSTGEQKPIEWLTLELILPLLVPEKMPNFDDKQVLKMELIDLIRQSTNLLMKPINDELKNRFDQFVRDHYSYNLEFAIDTNGHMSNADSVHCGQSMFDWPSVAANELTESQRKLSATAMYLMTFHLYRQTQEEAVGVARTVLMFGRHSLSDELLSSTWMIVAKANTRIVLYEDRKLFAHMDEMLFPFRMALLLRKNVAEAHLDVGILMYQCHARIRRFIRTDSSDQLVPNLKKQAFRLLSSCKVHFQLAELYKTQATDIMWLIQYFLGKVSEKFDQPIETVLQHYGECAKRMQSDKYTFPAKISRKTQHNFEPLELFYRVHKYLNFKRTVALKHNDLCTMQKIVAALKLWSNYGVSKNSWPNSPPFFQTDLSQLLNSTTAYSPNENTTTIGGLMEVMLEMVDLNEVADKMIVSAYKSILSRFPHYKSAYQLMQFYASEKKYAKAVDLMFTSIFSWSWTKKKISSGDSIFEQFTEIRRSDFERSKSSDYHIARIINSLAELLEKTQDAKRLAFVTHSLLVVNKPDDELISNECASRLILMCLKRLTRLIYSLMQRPNATLLKQLPLLLVINRNLHDNSFKGKHVKNLCSIIVVLQKQEEQRVAAERQARSTQQFRLASQTTALQTQQRLQTLFGQPNAQGIPPNVNMTQLYNRAQQVATQHGLSLESLVAQIETDIENGDATREQMYSFIRDS